MAPTINGKKIGNIGYGLMGLTTSAQPPSTATAIETMKAALEKGANFWNGGDFYGPNGGSLPLLREYFTKYPSDASKIALSIKGAFDLRVFAPDNSPANLRKNIDTCLAALENKVFIDIYQPARIDPKVPIEDSVVTIAEYVRAGKIGGIGLSECSAATIRRAHAVHPIAAVEVELSLFATDILTDGVAATCAELGIPVVAYSPLSRGFLTGALTKFEDLAPNDLRRRVPRFQPPNFEHNLALVDEVKKVSQRKGCTLAQTAIGWILALSEKGGLGTIVPIPGASSVARVEENLKAVELDKKDLEELDAVLKRIEVKETSEMGHPDKYRKG